jgi:hypothetical protein
VRKDRWVGNPIDEWIFADEGMNCCMVSEMISDTHALLRNPARLNHISLGPKDPVEAIFKGSHNLRGTFFHIEGKLARLIKPIANFPIGCDTRDLVKYGSDTLQNVRTGWLPNASGKGKVYIIKDVPRCPGRWDNFMRWKGLTVGW